ncbi:MAG: nuclear transport factor 2 family protein [Hellea sp.]
MTADDYYEIQNLINLYFQRVDAGDFEGCGTLFKKAVVHYPSSGMKIYKDPAAIAELMRSYVKLYGDAQTPLTRHHSGNIILEPTGIGTAKAQCSAIIFQGTPDLPFQAIGEASYSDIFAKIDGLWTFTYREINLNFMGDMSHHLSREVKS